MKDDLAPAVVALQRKLDEQLKAVADTKRTINTLMKMSGKDALFPEGENESSGAVRADQFYGKGLATAAAEYLVMRQQACQPDEVLQGLIAGGFDFDVLGWKEEDRMRSLAMSLAKNTGSAGKFHRLKNGSFGLRAWYDPEFLKKAASGADEAKGRQKGKGAKAKKTIEAKSALCSRGCGKPPHRGSCGPARPKPVTDDTKNSAKTESRPVADQTAQKGVNAVM